jgi:hypothetical protein
MSWRILIPATFCLAAFLVQVHGDDKSQVDLRGRLADEQDQLLKDCKDLEQKLQMLSARLEKSDRVEDRDRLALLHKALTILKTSNISGRLQTSVQRLRSSKALSAVEIAQAAQIQKASADEINNFLSLLAAEDRELEVSRMVLGYGKQLENLQDAIRKQQQACIAIENKDRKPAEFQKAAIDSVKATQQLADTSSSPSECPDHCELVRSLSDARSLQEQAESELADGKVEDALNHQQKAVAVLKSAEGKLGEQLNQVRSEQIERLLATMQSRCQRMFDMESTVRNGTVAVAGEINEGGTGLEEKIVQLAEDQDKVALEAHRATRLLEEQASTLALPEIFSQLRRDMISAAGRLRRLDVGVVTQAIQQDILDTLRETTDTIKKARRPATSVSDVTPGGGSATPNLVRAHMFAPKYAIDPVAESKLVTGVLNRDARRVDTMSDAEKQEFEAWKKRLPEGSEDVKGRLSKKDLERERRDANFRELTGALQIMKDQLGHGDRSEDRDKVDAIDRTLKFADDLKADDDRPTKLLSFLATQKVFGHDELDRQRRRYKGLAGDAIAAVAHRLAEARSLRDQDDWHDITVRTRDAQERLQKQAALLQQLQK